MKSRTVLLIFLTMLVPASMFLVPVQAQEDQSLVVSTSLGGSQDIPLKAIKDSDDNIDTQNDFEIEPQNVISVQHAQPFHVIQSDGSLIAVKATDVQRITTDLVFSQSDGRVTQNLASGTYLLDVIVEMDNDDRFLYETVLAVLAPGQTVNQVNVQNIIQNFVSSSSSSNSHTTVVFRNGDDNDDDQPDEDEPSICFFEPNNEACNPDEDGNCPEGFGHNDDGQCIPQQSCPQGFHRANDDETGRCIDEDELRQCENNGGWVEEGEFCPEDELPICNVDHSNEPCISGQEEPEPEANDPCNYYGQDVCIGEGEERQCDTERFDCLSDCEDGTTATTGQCPGDDEDRTTTAPPTPEPEPESTATEPESEPETTDSEETVEEIEEREEETEEEEN